MGTTFPSGRLAAGIVAILIIAVLGFNSFAVINTGYVGMYKAMRLYRDVGFKGVFIDDHCPDIEGDRPFQDRDGGYQSRAFAQGYIQAMLEVVQKQGG